MRKAETILGIIRECNHEDSNNSRPAFVAWITGELRDTETVTRSSEGGHWKSTCEGNSLVTYPTMHGS